ncbi:iron/manganese transporter [Taibaiella sp. KBW10]|uniref:Nramp family divalent metal transporter n=1 Tax=Taibaiella sp. KBW10 TaxID=2153357 RepID=UPI000F5B8291|nr:Nramp family divalent metal transporter [Taibaiella sp. KBW10]RQO30865.1 iron/manganese transporter [Taibaiella sp. KBW10]
MDKQHRSLHDVHSSVDITSKKNGWRKIMAFFGPAYLVSVGYMDPGNWATDLAGGSQFGYTLIWVLLCSNLIALFLQSLCTRLGIVRGKDLAQCNRETYPKGMNFVLYLLAEIAIAACDLAEILGMAIGLQLLFGLDLMWGVLISFGDTFLLLYLQRLGIRKMELFIIGTIFIIGMCFLIEMFLAKPDMHALAKGFIPSLPNTQALYIAIGIIGATVMPHNLYLHSALVQTRKIGKDHNSIKKAIKYNFWDSAIALNLAFFVNAAILILAASVFHKNGMTEVAELEDAHKLLSPTIGSEWASRLFAVALIAAGQSSTITGTLAGQIVMEGYLQLRISPALRRIITRLLAVVPAVIVIALMGNKGVGKLLIFSQVLLSMQLSFAIIPLIYFVSDKKQMGRYAIPTLSKIIGWLIVVLVGGLNLKLVYESIQDILKTDLNPTLKILLVIGGIGLLVLLALTIIYPLYKRTHKVNIDIHKDAVIAITEVSGFNTIAVALDYSEVDQKTISYALKLAHEHTTMVLIHVVESAAALRSGPETQDYETHKDLKRLREYVDFISSKGYNVISVMGYTNRVKEIAKSCETYAADLLVVGSHGHRGLKDFIYGETVNNLRHKVKIPVFIAQ